MEQVTLERAVELAQSETTHFVLGLEAGRRAVEAGLNGDDALVTAARSVDFNTVYSPEKSGTRYDQAEAIALGVVVGVEDGQHEGVSI